MVAGSYKFVFYSVDISGGLTAEYGRRFAVSLRVCLVSAPTIRMCICLIVIEHWQVRAIHTLQYV